MSQYREFRWNKGVRYVPYYLIAVHEEAADEGAHEQLIADRFCLWYRDTFLPTSSETSRSLPRTESWVSAWLESFFRSTSELLLNDVDKDGGTACSARNRTDGRDDLVAGWPKSNWERTRVVGMPSSDGHGAFVLAVLEKGASLLWLLRGCNSHLTSQVSGVDNTELDNGQPVRSRHREYGCGRRWWSNVTASYDRDTDDDEVQRSKELTVMGERTRKAQCITLYVRDSNKEKLSKSFNQSWVYFLALF
jgi:hypothetical protein